MVIILIFPLLGLWIYYYKWMLLNDEYTEHYKDKVVRKIIELYFDKTINYFPKAKVSFHAFKESNLYYKTSLYVGEDKLKGLLHGLPFECSEIDASYSTSNDTSRYVFKGIFIVMEFNKIIQKKTIVKVKNNNKLRSSTYDKVLKENNFNNLKKIEVDNLDFGRIYDIYSEDEVESRYILTQPLMERMLELSIKFDNIEYSFVGNKMYMAIESDKDYFETSLSISVRNSREIIRYIEVIEDIGSIVDVLKLDEYLWSKEKR